MNKVILIGEISRTKHFDNVSNYTIKTTKIFNNKKISNYFILVAFKSVANRNDIRDGMIVCIEGELGVNKYEKDGKTMYSTQIIVYKMSPICFNDALIEGNDNIPADHYNDSNNDEMPF